MTPMQQMLLGVGAKKKTYMDDVFSTYLHVGTGSAKTINNGIDLAGEGGLIWAKSRSHSHVHVLQDTVRGAGKAIFSSSANAEHHYSLNNTITSFNSNGFSVGADTSGSINYVESGGNELSAWTFRRAKGFFDIVTWTGDGTDKLLSHNLGCIPGCIILKNRSATDNWIVYHRSNTDTPQNVALFLNTNAATSTGSAYWNNTAHTSTQFSIDAFQNESGVNYVAYLFAGGESTQNEAVSVDFDGTGDYLESNTSSDYSFGTGDFTIEGWYKFDSIGNDGLFMQGSGGISDYTGPTVYYDNSGTSNGLSFKAAGSLHNSANYPSTGQWHHIALVRHSGVTKLYLNGTLIKSATDTTNYTNTDIVIGGYYSSTYVMNGQVSNFRVVKGTAVYTSSFRPPTKPLTSISGTALLCCNNSSVTGATTGSVTSVGGTSASTDSPFDDPAGFVFGDSKEGIIKCGSYVGNGSATGPVINLGWEPQWVLLKRTSASEDWILLDNMRGIVTDGNDPETRPNAANADQQVARSWIDVSPTGFQLKSNPGHTNADGDNYIYMAIRRSDGYVGKPADAGTSVFAMDVGNGSSTIPVFDSGFPVDFALQRKPASTFSTDVVARLTGDDYLQTNNSNAANDASTYTFDSNSGWCKDSGADSNFQSWMWKRHAGFDVVTYTGNSTAGHQIPHSLSKTPEMLWIKCRSTTKGWPVYHKGLNGGSSPEDYVLFLNDTDAELDDVNYWNDTAPTATNFTLGNSSKPNSSGETYIAMLFASVDGISKVGSYTGNGTVGHEITGLGFQPRFIIIKGTASVPWVVFDTLRGWGSGNDELLYLNDTTAQINYSYGAPISDGFRLDWTGTYGNSNGDKFIYYAHA